MSKWGENDWDFHQSKFRKCDECGRSFDLSDDADSEDFFFGHDCEA